MSRHYLRDRAVTPGPLGLSERNKNGERTSGTSGTGDNKNGGDEKTAE